MNEAESKQTDDFSAMVDNLLYTETADEVLAVRQQMESIVPFRTTSKECKRVADVLNQTGRCNADVQRQYERLVMQYRKSFVFCIPTNLTPTGK